jgi:molybdopterin-guanine dinucleotide biosynthesis protein B
MKIIGISGWSGSGKTTLLEKLIPLLCNHGYTVSTIKHAHHRFDVDKPGKDSYRHRAAGATEVMVSSAHRWALMHENRGADEPPLEALIARMSPVDILLVEGFKQLPFAKIEVWRSGGENPPLHLSDPSVIAIATDAACPDSPLPVLDLNAPATVADFIIHHLMPEVV